MCLSMQRQEHTNTVQTQEDTGLLVFYCHIHIYALYSLQGVQNNCGWESKKIRQAEAESPDNVCGTCCKKGEGMKGSQVKSPSSLILLKYAPFNSIDLHSPVASLQVKWNNTNENNFNIMLLCAAWKDTIM